MGSQKFLGSFIPILALILRASASSIDSLPDCAKICYPAALSRTGLNVIKHTATVAGRHSLCLNGEFQAALRNCARDLCSEHEYNYIVEGGKSYCEEVGLPVEGNSNDRELLLEAKESDMMSPMEDNKDLDPEASLEKGDDLDTEASPANADDLDPEASADREHEIVPEDSEQADDEEVIDEEEMDLMESDSSSSSEPMATSSQRTTSTYSAAATSPVSRADTTQTASSESATIEDNLGSSLRILFALALAMIVGAIV